MHYRFLLMNGFTASFPRYRVLAIFQRSPKQSRAFSLSNKLRFSNFHCFTFSSKSSKPNINWPDSSVVEYVLWVISTLVRGLGFNVSLMKIYFLKYQTLISTAPIRPSLRDFSFAFRPSDFRLQGLM